MSVSVANEDTQMEFKLVRKGDSGLLTVLEGIFGYSASQS